MIRIIAPGTDCTTDRASIACTVANAIIEGIYNEYPQDIMTIHNESGDCLSEISVRDEKVCFCHSGKTKTYSISYAENVIVDLICKNI